MSRPEKLRVLQVGLGDWGRDWAWRVNPTIDEIEIVGYVDSDPSALELLHRKWPSSVGRTYSAFTAAVETARPDAALITTTLQGHAGLVRAALEADMHVLVEKPFTETLDSATQLVALAAARRRVLMVSQNYRFFPAPRAAAAVVAGGELGDLYEVAVDFRRDFSSPPKPRSRLHMDSQPLLVDMSIHHFDLMRLIIGHEPHRVLCTTFAKRRGGFNGPPAAALSFQFGDVAVNYRGSWVSAAPITPWAGLWTMEFAHGSITWTSRGDEGVLSDRLVITRRGRPPRTVKLAEMDRMDRIDRAGTLGEFASAIRMNRQPETSGRDNLRTMAMAMAAVESSDRSAWVDVPSVDD